MKVVVALDSFKGSMNSLEAGNAAKRGVLQCHPEAEVVVIPLADGGEGTVDALIEGLQGNRVNIEVSDPIGRATQCIYGILPDGTAIMEMAQAAGLEKLSEKERNPLYTSTYGVGEMIVDAMNRGCRKFVIGIGGSATNDGGMGMLSALGYEFLDDNGQAVKPGAQALSRVKEIRTSGVHAHLRECTFQVACDVDNPLCGINGATYVYGLQKGLPEDLCQSVDDGMKQYAGIVEDWCKKYAKEHKKNEVLQSGKSYMNYPGAGAAGGLGFAFLIFLHGELVSGIDLILDTVGLEQELPQADVVITGEGRIDAQTAMGKAPIGVAKRAKKYGCRVLAFAGCIGDDAQVCKEKGIDEYYSIASEAVPLEERMKKENAICNMQNAVVKMFSNMDQNEKRIEI